MKFSSQTSSLRKFVKRHKRLPKQTATDPAEKRLARWVNYIKKRARGKQFPTLKQAEVTALKSVPGWTFERWQRNEKTGTRRGTRGWEAHVQLDGTIHHGPARSSNALARQDYLVSRAEADKGKDALLKALQKLKSK